eukprot:2177383-Rhodomonas_salina.2
MSIRSLPTVSLPYFSSALFWKVWTHPLRKIAELETFGVNERRFCRRRLDIQNMHVWLSISLFVGPCNCICSGHAEGTSCGPNGRFL